MTCGAHYLMPERCQHNWWLLQRPKAKGVERCMEPCVQERMYCDRHMQEALARVQLVLAAKHIRLLEAEAA